MISGFSGSMVCPDRIDHKYPATRLDAGYWILMMGYKTSM